MKIEIDSYEAKTKLPELLRQVKSGKTYYALAGEMREILHTFHWLS